MTRIPWCLTHETPATTWWKVNHRNVLVCTEPDVDEWGFRRPVDCDVRVADVHERTRPWPFRDTLEVRLVQ